MGALHSHPTATRHFYRVKEATEHFCQAGQYRHRTGTAGPGVASGASLPGGQRVPGTLATGFGVLRVANV